LSSLLNRSARILGVSELQSAVISNAENVTTERKRKELREKSPNEARMSYLGGELPHEM